MEEIEAAVVGRVGGGKAEVPFADEGGVVAGGVEVVRERGDFGIEVAPRIFGIGADESGHADAIRVAAAQ